MAMYTNDNNDTLPCVRPKTHEDATPSEPGNIVWWSNLVTLYYQEASQSAGKLRCEEMYSRITTSNREGLGIGYAMNGSLCCKKASIVVRPDRCMLICEYGGGSYNASTSCLLPNPNKTYNDGWLMTPHSDTANILAVAGNVRTMVKDEITQEVNARTFWEYNKD